MNPHESRPLITYGRANAIGDKVQEIAQELLNLRYTIEDSEQDNPLVLRLCDALEAHGSTLSALAHCWPLAPRVER